jgi:hypothetical protein
VRPAVKLCMSVALALLMAAAASGAAATDGAISMDLSPGVKRVGKVFVGTVKVVDATQVDVHDAYDLTVTVSVTPGLQIVKATSSFTIPFRCTRGTRSLACSGRVIGGDVDASTHSQIVIVKALKAGKQTITAKVAIAGDANVANDTVAKSLTVKPKPKPRKRA